jgi:hypothetical protein
LWKTGRYSENEPNFKTEKTLISRQKRRNGGQKPTQKNETNPFMDNFRVLLFSTKTFFVVFCVEFQLTILPIEGIYISLSFMVLSAQKAGGIPETQKTIVVTALRSGKKARPGGSKTWGFWPVGR